MKKPEIVQFRTRKSANRQWYHLYRCECGNIFETKGSNVNSGNTKSCGCYQLQKIREFIENKKVTHGHSRKGKWNPVYTTWVNMIDRCTNHKNSKYAIYGGRGIVVCQQWLDSYESFYSYMGERPPGRMSIDRIDSNGNYEPGNVRWATYKEQANNRAPRGTYKKSAK